MSPEELAVLIAAVRLNECLMFDQQAVEAMDDLTAAALQRLQHALEGASYPKRMVQLPHPGVIGPRTFRQEADPFSPEAQASMRRHPSSDDEG